MPPQTGPKCPLYGAEGRTGDTRDDSSLGKSLGEGAVLYVELLTIIIVILLQAWLWTEDGGLCYCNLGNVSCKLQ